MSVNLPKYGLKVPSEATRFNALGKELRELGESLEHVLDSFDYSGSDPNAVIAQVVALEEYKDTELKNRLDSIDNTFSVISAVEAISRADLISLGADPKPAFQGASLKKNFYGLVTGYIATVKGAGYIAGQPIYRLPIGFRPIAPLTFPAVVTGTGSPYICIFQLNANGDCYLHGLNQSFNANTNLTISLSFSTMA